MMLRKNLVWVLAAALLVALPACGDDDDDNNGANNGAVTDTGQDTTDVGTDTDDDVSDTDDDTDDSDDTDDDPTPADIILSNFNVLHSGGNQWQITAFPYNPGDEAIVIDRCDYEARTVSDDELITDGTLLEDHTLDPPQEGVDNAMIMLEFEPSEGEETVEATMTMECFPAEGEVEADPDNNVGTATFDW